MTFNHKDYESVDVSYIPYWQVAQALESLGFVFWLSDDGETHGYQGPIGKIVLEDADWGVIFYSHLPEAELIRLLSQIAELAYANRRLTSVA